MDPLAQQVLNEIYAAALERENPRMDAADLKARPGLASLSEQDFQDGITLLKNSGILAPTYGITIDDNQLAWLLADNYPDFTEIIRRAV